MTTPPELTKLISAAEDGAATATSAELVTLLGDLERLKARVWQRLLVLAAMPATAPAPLEELQHLTPARVGELLNLTEPYVHELCRTGKLAARKQGKYWIIPVRALREWAATPQEVDSGSTPPVRSADTPRGSPRLLRRRHHG